MFSARIPNVQNAPHITVGSPHIVSAAELAHTQATACVLQNIKLLLTCVVR